MALSVTHTFVSAIADDPTASAAGEVLPSHWNASHTLTGQVDLTSQVTGILPAANGGTGTSTGYLPRTVNAQTGTTYTVLASDIGKLVTTSNAAAIATTLPQATGSFGAGSILWIENKGAGTNTITPTTSTIDGSATLALTTNQGVTLVSDGTNWTTIRGIGGAGGGTPGGSNTQVQYNSSSSFAGSANLTFDGTHLFGAKGVFGSTAAWDPAVFGSVLEVDGTGSGASAEISRFSADANPPLVILTKSRGASLGTKTSVTSGDALGEVTAWGYDATAVTPVIQESANIVFSADAAPTTGSVAGRIVFSTSASGSATPTEHLRIDSTGIASLSNGTSASAHRLYNSVDSVTSPTNYERGVFDWTTSANVLTIGVQAGGTGTVRSLNVVYSHANALTFTRSDGFTVACFGGNAGSFLNLISNYGIGWTSGSNANASTDTSISRTAAGVVTLGSSGWMQWGGQARVTSDFPVTSSTALVNVTGLSVTVQAGRTYWFETELYVTDAAAGGVQAAIAGTATATAIQYTGYTIADNAIKGKTNATALATAVGSTTTTETAGIIVRITGIITVNAGGTLTVQMAQNTSNGTATTAKRGSYLFVHDMP